MVGGAFFRIAHPYLISARSSGATPNCLIASLRSFNFRPRATYRRHFTSSQFLSISPSSLSKTQVGRQYDVELDDETNEKDITEEVVSYEEPLPLAGEDSARSERSSSDATKPSPAARPPLPVSIKKLNRLLGRQQLGEIPEHELKEQFVRGSGPGGQAINKTSSSVSLIHLPTGIRVQAQPTRSREANRKAARRILAAKLDLMIATGSWTREDGNLTKGEAVTSADLGGEVADLGGSRKEIRKREEVELAGKWTRQEILWEKERRRKVNRSKKSKKKQKEVEADIDD